MVAVAATVTSPKGNEGRLQLVKRLPTAKVAIAIKASMEMTYLKTTITYPARDQTQTGLSQQSPE